MEATRLNNSSNRTRTSKTGQRGTEAYVSARAKCEMVVGVAPDVEHEGAVEHLLIVVGRWVPHDHPVSGHDGPSSHDHFLGGGASEMHCHRRGAKDLLGGRCRQAGRVVAQLLHLVRMLEEIDQAVTDRVSRRLVPGDHHQGKEVLELQVGERLAVGFGGQEHSDDVVGRVVSTLPRHLLGITKDLESRRRSEREQPVLLGVHLVDDHRGVLRVGIGDHLISPCHQLLRVRLRHTEKPAEEPDRQLTCDLGHEVEPAEGEDTVEDIAGQDPEGTLIGRHHLGGESGLDQPPQPGVLRRVELHHGPPRLELVWRHLLDPDPPRGGESPEVRGSLQRCRNVWSAPRSPDRRLPRPKPPVPRGASGRRSHEARNERMCRVM